jgi:CRISPR-associated protein Cmr5
MAIRDQEFAQKAFGRVSAWQNKNIQEKENYQSFSKRFPALIHNCGLAQAVAFAQAKNQDYIADLAFVLGYGSAELGCISREALLVRYQMLSRNALSSATWLQRYAEALLKGGD